jgi:hypothetical protein
MCLYVSCNSVIYCCVFVLCLCVMWVTCLLYCSTTATGLNPNCSLTNAPYYVKLTPDQIFNHGTPDAGAVPATGKSAVHPAGNDGANGGSSTST